MTDHTAVSIKNHVEYSHASIVSKTILDKKTGTVTLFAFDQGQRLSEHTAPFDALVNVLDGEAVITIGGTDTIVGEDSFIIMPANIPHAVRADKRFKMMLVMIKS